VARLALEISHGEDLTIGGYGSLAGGEDDRLGTIDTPRLSEPEPLLPRPGVDLPLSISAPPVAAIVRRRAYPPRALYSLNQPTMRARSVK